MIFNKIKYRVNVCDNIDRDIEIHFTKACENDCSFCIDKLNEGINEPRRPNIDKIILTLIKYNDKFDYIGIAGGEPCMYIDELEELCMRIKNIFPKKHLNLITSVPNICDKKYTVFENILKLCDTIVISPQHHDQNTADEIRKKKSTFDRESFYRRLPYKNKITLTINLIKGYLDTFEDVKNCLLYYNKLGFTNFKLCELSQRPSMFVDLEKVLCINLPPAFSHGCVDKEYNIKKLIPEFDGKLTLKRTCFYNNQLKKATFLDFIKACTRWLFAKEFFFGVVYGNGKIYKYWE
jgi:hypothetical protein